MCSTGSSLCSLQLGCFVLRFSPFLVFLHWLLFRQLIPLPTTSTTCLPLLLQLYYFLLSTILLWWRHAACFPSKRYGSDKHRGKFIAEANLFFYILLMLGVCAFTSALLPCYYYCAQLRRAGSHPTGNNQAEFWNRYQSGTSWSVSLEYFIGFKSLFYVDSVCLLACLQLNNSIFLQGVG